MTTAQNIFYWPLRVYYEDTDAGGIVYYANYLKFLERARTEWLRSLGIEQDGWLELGIGFVVRHVELDLRQPARFNAELRVAVAVEQLKRASVVFSQWIENAEGEMICRATVKAACVDFNQAAGGVKPIPMPAVILEELKRATS